LEPRKLKKKKPVSDNLDALLAALTRQDAARLAAAKRVL
jgi:hypothetical protein